MTEQVLFQPNEKFAIMPIFILQRTRDGNPQHGWDQWVSFGARPEVFFTKYLSLALEGGFDHAHSSYWTIRWLAKEIHHRTTNWSGTPVFQPSRFTSIPHIRELVGWTAGICRRNSLPESNQWAHLWSAGRNLVVGERKMATRE